MTDNIKNSQQPQASGRADAVDAARYRWLRNESGPDSDARLFVARVFTGTADEILEDAALDRAVDEAIETSERTERQTKHRAYCLDQLRKLGLASSPASVPAPSAVTLYEDQIIGIALRLNKTGRGLIDSSAAVNFYNEIKAAERARATPADAGETIDDVSPRMTEPAFNGLRETSAVNLCFKCGKLVSEEESANHPCCAVIPTKAGEGK